MIEDGVPAPRGVPLFQVSQLHAQHCSLQSVKTAIVAAEQVLIFFLLTVVAQHLQTSRDPPVIGDHYPAIAIGPQVFSGIEAESCCVPQRACPPSFVARPVGLASVFNNDQSMFVREFTNRIHVRGMAVQVDGNHRFRSRGNGFLDGRNVHGVSGWIDIHKDRPRAGVGYCQRRSDEAVRGGNDFVAGSDVVCPEGQLQCRRARIHADGVFRLAKRRKLFLEEAYFTSQDKVGLLYYSGRRLTDFSFDRAVLSTKINERHLWLFRGH